MFTCQFIWYKDSIYIISAWYISLIWNAFQSSIMAVTLGTLSNFTMKAKSFRCGAWRFSFVCFHRAQKALNYAVRFKCWWPKLTVMKRFASCLHFQALVISGALPLHAKKRHNESMWSIHAGSLTSGEAQRWSGADVELFCQNAWQRLKISEAFTACKMLTERWEGT